MHIENIYLTPVSDFANQVRDPFQMHVTNQHLDQLDEMRRNNGGELRANDIATVMGRTMVPAIAEAEHVDIIGGWEGERYHCLISVVAEPIDAYGQGQRVILSGYTDRQDITSADQIADNLIIFLNSVITVRDEQYRDPNTGIIRVKSTVTGNTQLLNGLCDPRNNEYDVVTRPQDVFSMLNQIHDLGQDSMDCGDDRFLFMSGAKTSNRSNNMGGRYMSKLIESDRSGREIANTYTDSVFQNTRNSSAWDTAKDPLINVNLVLSVLYNNQTSSTFSDGRSIEYADLASLTEHNTIEEVDAVTEVEHIQDKTFDYHADDMNGAFEEVSIAVLIANALPAILAETAMSRIFFCATNQDTDCGKLEYEIFDAMSFIRGIEFDFTLEQIIMNRFKDEVFRHISKENQLGLWLEIDCDVAGVTRIKVQVGSIEGPMEFVVPSFADSNLAPVITQDIRKLRDLADKFVAVRKAIDCMDDDSAQYHGNSMDSIEQRRSNNVYRDVNSILDVEDNLMF